ncbi:MAG: S-methyl-5-thioribose-1-phosphate isomerase [Bacillota bacterium]|nr:S-methyl-5-thioribose-1-phosphate isomerase [Bacillota bacterium]
MGRTEPIRPVEWTEEGLVIVDQTRLPGELRRRWLRTVEEVVGAIRRLEVRGAPAIGIAAAFGVVLGVDEAARRQRRGARAAGALPEPTPEALVRERERFLRAVEEAADQLASSRPTAVNLFWALRRMRRRAHRAVMEGGGECDGVGGWRAWRQALVEEAAAILEEDRSHCRAIGAHGAALLEELEATAVLTHCNAGSLATAQYGTALAPVYELASRGRRLRVFVDESRPLLQGSRLTAWELHQAGLPVTLITDGTAATVLRRGWVQAVLVGADRVAANGDVANKIGTYPLAVLAQRHRVPFLVALPSSSVDLELEEGGAIPIEERGADEVRSCGGRPVAPAGVEVFNPAFDVTPNELVTAFVTELGVIRPPFAEGLRRLKEAAEQASPSSGQPR